MRLLSKIRSWFRREPRPVSGDDLIMQHVLSRCFETGNVIIANRRDDGTVEIEEIPVDDDSKSKDQP